MKEEIDRDYAEFLKLLGARVKQLRQERGLSLRDMVVKHDYHDSQWRRFERGGAVNVPSLLKIAKVFNVSLSSLLDGLGVYPAITMKELEQKEAPVLKVPKAKRTASKSAKKSA